MNIKQLSRQVAAIERADQVAKSECPEAALGDLTAWELELVRAVIRRCMSERRDNMIEFLRLEALATSESWKDKNTGQQQERAEWHRVIFFNRLAEIACLRYELENTYGVTETVRAVA